MRFSQSSVRNRKDTRHIQSDGLVWFFLGLIAKRVPFIAATYAAPAAVQALKNHFLRSVQNEDASRLNFGGLNMELLHRFFEILVGHTSMIVYALLVLCFLQSIGELVNSYLSARAHAPLRRLRVSRADQLIELEASSLEVEKHLKLILDDRHQSTRPGEKWKSTIQ
jgi:hypothetical protein